MGITTGLTSPTTLKAIANRLRESYGAERVLVYGSVARGDQTEDSDIDLLVIAPTTERFYERMGSVQALVRDLGHDMPLAPIVLTPEELATRLDHGDQFVEEMVLSGVDL